jgi:hypothetical protein
VNALFARIRLTRPYCVWVGVADPKGTVVHATGNQLVGRNISDNTWFTAGASGPYVSDVVPAKLLAPLLPPAPRASRCGWWISRPPSGWTAS